MKLLNFNTIYSTANSLYGVDADTSELEDIALIGWELIGNKHTRLYKYVVETTGRRIKLPCNVEIIESVTIPVLDSKTTGPEYDGVDYNSQYIESYTEGHKSNTSTIYNPGKLVKYRLEGDELVFDRDYSKVCILYHGIIVDDEGLPLITDKELLAIATYIAYSHLYKKSIMQKDGNLIQLATVIKADWLRACTAARTSEYLNQNDMDAIAEVRVRWDRKTYGKSFKPIV